MSRSIRIFLIRMFSIRIFSFLIFYLTVVGCASTGSTENAERKEAPKITHKMPLDEIIQAGIDFGGITARDARKAIGKRKEWPAAEKILVSAITSGVSKYENFQLVNAVMIYLSGPVKASESLFRTLVGAERPIARQLAWQLAAAQPSKVMRVAIDRELSRALLEGDDSEVLLPQMAQAVQANRMTTAYTLVRHGLMTLGTAEFAGAMATLDPVQASQDFIDYLAICPPDELRQLSVSSVNVYAATVALNHLIKSPPSMGHPRLEVAFYYAISRNPGLGELGASLVDVLAMKDQRGMAITLSRLPTWAQIAYIENVRSNMSATRRVFLSELKKTSPQSEVAEELGEIKL